MPFDSRLNYSFGNEDYATEQKALQIKPDNIVLSITASGDRPLHLLLDNPKQVIAVDANRMQTDLLNLKTAAMRTFDFDEYLSFLGACQGDKREGQFEKALKHMDPASAQFWSGHLSMILKGVLYQGHIERVTKYVAGTAHLLRPFKMHKLFHLDDLEEQRRFIGSAWDTLPMRTAFDIVLSRFCSKLFIIDPGLYANLDDSMRLGPYIYNRMLKALKKCLAKENLLISLIFRGFVGKEAFPPYLLPKGFASIRQRLEKLTPVTENVITYMEKAPEKSFDRFSLSDVASYMHEKDFNRMIGAIHHSAKPDARFCIRQFTSNYQIPPEFAGSFIREPHLEKELEEEDRCFVYRFLVGTIQK